jgi:hypothetical protein
MPMHYRYFYKHVDEPCWGPLERVAELTIVSSDLPVIDPGHFMYMARLESAGRPDLNLYKHYYTRWYLNLDDAGHAEGQAASVRRRAVRTSARSPHGSGAAGSRIPGGGVDDGPRPGVAQSAGGSET